MQWVARQSFHHRSAQMQGWGGILLLAAGALWVWLAFLLWDQADAYCYRTVSNCTLITAWPRQLTILAASVPLSVAGAALLVGGSVRRQTSAHVLRIIELQKSEDRARTKK